MTRREFRVALDSPRPLAAIALAGVSSATLGVTGQIAPAALVAQGLALLWVTLFRREPFAFQRSAVVLNALLAAIVIFAIHGAANGAPSLVALAHFALLAQGLQLVDARPRRSEFLLVALALFQVILASNLTDSLLFPPLLVIFLPTAVWTLIVHTLRTEALEAGTPAAADRALTPALLRTTLVASVLSIALALALFVVLPRMPSHLVRGPIGARSAASAGFSDRVTLGDLGRIRGDDTVILRVETVSGTALPPERAYWRGLAFDEFDGRAWRISSASRRAITRDAELGVEIEPGPKPDLVQRLVREPVDSGVLFGAPTARLLEGAVGPVERDRNGGLYAPRTPEERVRYTVQSRVAPPPEEALRADVAEMPPSGERYLALPPLSDAVRRLAEEAVRDASGDADRARALERWLRRTGRYTDVPPKLDPADPRSPVEVFLLGERAGHCEYFASAMVVMARSLGLPARLVNGLAGGRDNRIGGFVELTRSDAHAWVEIHYRRAGWVAYDPTPPDLRLRGAAAGASVSRLEDLRSALELWWFQRVVNFDRSDQLRALRAAWSAWRRLRPASTGSEPAPAAAAARSREMPPFLGVGVALAVAGATGALLWRRRRRARPAMPAAYAAALRLLARRGLVRDAATPAREFALVVRERLPEPAAAAFLALTESYLAERFGGCLAPGAQAELRALRDSLRA